MSLLVRAESDGESGISIVATLIPSTIGLTLCSDHFMNHVVDNT